MELAPTPQMQHGGRGMVNLHFPVFLFKNKIVHHDRFEQPTFPVTDGSALFLVPPNFGPGLATAVTPSSLPMKSQCHHRAGIRRP